VTDVIELVAKRLLWADKIIPPERHTEESFWQSKPDNYRWFVRRMARSILEVVVGFTQSDIEAALASPEPDIMSKMDI
jgi:hypothetical protein